MCIILKKIIYIFSPSFINSMYRIVNKLINAKYENKEQFLIFIFLFCIHFLFISFSIIYQLNA